MNDIFQDKFIIEINSRLAHKIPLIEYPRSGLAGRIDLGFTNTVSNVRYGFPKGKIENGFVEMRQSIHPANQRTKGSLKFQVTKD